MKVAIILFLSAMVLLSEVHFSGAELIGKVGVLTAKNVNSQGSSDGSGNNAGGNDYSSGGNDYSSGGDDALLIGKLDVLTAKNYNLQD